MTIQEHKWPGKDWRPLALVHDAHLKAVALDPEDSGWDEAAAAGGASAAVLAGRLCHIPVSLLLQPASNSFLPEPLEDSVVYQHAL